MMPIHSTFDVYPLNKGQPFYENMEHYISARLACLYDHRVDHDFTKVAQDASSYLTEWTGERIIERASSGDPDAVLDMAIRYLSGCGTVRQNFEGALYVLDAILDPTCDRACCAGDRITPTIIAQAHSCAASALLAKLALPPDQVLDLYEDEARFDRAETKQANASGDPAVARLALAVHHANESAKAGLVSSTVLRVGQVARETAAKLGVDTSQLGRSRHMRYLSRAVDARLEVMWAEERTRLKKAAKSPNDYVCATEGCGIRAEGRTALRACAGKCPPDLKPHYCSKKCQTKDWPKHKTVCKGGSEKALSVKDKAKALELFAPGDGEDEDETPLDEPDTSSRPLEHGPPGHTRTIDIPAPNAPGGSIHISSNTLAPEAMRSLRTELSKLMVGEPSGSGRSRIGE